MVGTSPRPLTAGQGDRGVLRSCSVSRKGAELQTELVGRKTLVPGQEAFACLQQGDTDLILRHDDVLFSVFLLARSFSTEHLHSSW